MAGVGVGVGTGATASGALPLVVGSAVADIGGVIVWSSN
jgi:hypothetical protein